MEISEQKCYIHNNQRLTTRQKYNGTQNQHGLVAVYTTTK